MGGLSIWHWAIVGILLLLLFGKGRFSEMMGDMAKGVKSFKQGLQDDEPAAPTAATPPPAPRIETQTAIPTVEGEVIQTADRQR